MFDDLIGKLDNLGLEKSNIFDTVQYSYISDSYSVNINIDEYMEAIHVDIRTKHGYNFYSNRMTNDKVWEFAENYIVGFINFKSKALLIDESLPYVLMFTDYMSGKKYIEEYDEIIKNKVEGVDFLTTNYPKPCYGQGYKIGYENNDLYGCVVEYDSDSGLSFEKLRMVGYGYENK